MKYRLDFVTNSSSSSFIYAYKGEVPDKVKMDLGEIILRELLGERVLTKDSSEEEIKKYFYDNYIEDTEGQERIRKCLEKGQDIYSGCVDFEFADGSLKDYFDLAIKVLRENSEPDGFTSIETNFDY